MKKAALVLMVFCLGLVALTSDAGAWSKGFEAEPGGPFGLGVAGSDSVTGPFTLVESGGVSNGSYLEVVNNVVGNSNSAPPAADDGWITWSFSAPAGTYKIIAKMRRLGSDSFWWRIIDSTGAYVETPWPLGMPIRPADGFIRWNGAGGGSWGWDNVHEDQIHNDLDRLPVTFVLPKGGDYKIQCARREDGTGLDGLLITDDLFLRQGQVPSTVPPTWDVANGLVLYEAWQFEVPGNMLPMSADLEGNLTGFPTEPTMSGGIHMFTNHAWDSNQRYVMRFKGIMKINQAGPIGLRTRSDDGSMMFIGNWWEEGAQLQQIIDNNGGHGMRNRDVELEVEEGYLGIVVTFCQGGGGDGLQVSTWSPGVSPHQLGQADLVSLTDASIPSPMHQATEVPLDATLSWEPPVQSVPSEYTVNVGLWGQDMTSSAVVTTNSYAPVGLEGGKTYKWRVDTTEPNDLPGGVPTVRKGTEWLFTTTGSITITSQPAGVNAEAGESVELSIAAESGLPLSYQWKLDGEDVVGATDAELVIASLDESTAGVYTCVVSNSAVSVESSGAVVSIKELIAYWPLDGNGLDMSGNNYHLVAQGDTTFDVGMGNQAAVFDGAGDDLVQSDPNFPVGDAINGNTGITIACWIKSDIINTDKGFIIFQPPAGNDDFDMRYDSVGATGGADDVLKMGITTTAAGVRQIETSDKSQTTEWQHVVMTWESGGRIRGYINGVEEVYTAQAGASGGTLTGFGEVIIGRGGKDDNATTEGWDGMVDEVYVYNYAKTPGEVLKMYFDETGGGEPTCLPGTGGPMDFNNDCVVDILDLAAIIDAYLNSNITE